ncbi:Pkinase-domain-containing protein [Hortaea werneckii]|uniref:non-specific serine/threonine protein kinase n=2 Tax=Hortaea werneckii TaxID=91943 RepID=A0A3M7IVE1_HORWE|nr:Pkinase-domain-containing protein [Hortaea werneckii]KAI7445828.1 Pkinase-domain-containing protein [Hortaea werneckii]OTA30551.1 hypothetical protein BTJ68_10910 [Hortaea werneckii EXF-2000]RMZ29511.1 hypothetical protein D0859_06414 [Hortaea werneckii]
MAEWYMQNRQAGKRQPLTEIKSGGNTTPSQTRHVRSEKSTSPSPLQHLPHNESLEANGTLAIRSSQPNSPENKRVSQIAGEYERDSKRNSAISTASTNASGRRRKTYIGHWQLGRTIGKGGCSRVRVVRHRFRDNQYGAVKIITRSTAESTRAQSLANLIESTRGNASFTASGYKPIPYGLEREIAVMKLLEHPNIVRLYDVWENRNELYLIMEYVDGGELFHYVDERKGLHEDEAVYIFRQIVSALLYCHRLLICHRDLKPENILLNKEDLTVKLIDFGMAALQPKGRLLSTPCGSPHYAAPEVVSSRPYDGTQADVWSCGVILYVMLTGTTPFNYSQDGDIRVLFRYIAKADYFMPPDLSAAAKDLIRRIFVPDPSKRITMDEVWNHPLLHKYDKEFGFVGKAGTKEAAIGPTPTVEQWKVKRIQDIDREILRNMRTLWHSEPEQSLIQKLLNNEYNQEKLFYAALIKHRDENLENYMGAQEDMDYSASDYHHSVPPKASKVPPLPAQRSQSAYSIMNDEHLRPSQSFVEPPPSEHSYDPYRASRNPMINARGEYVNVTVHRQGSTNTRKASVHDKTLRHPHALRVEALRQNNRRISHPSSSSLPRSGRSRVSMVRSTASRNSLSSSLWPSSPPAIATTRPSERHKRGVSFGHIRRASSTSAATPDSNFVSPDIPSPPEDAREKTLRALESQGIAASSPSVQAAQAVRSRKEKAPLIDLPRIRVRRPESSSQHMRSDIRKQSAELEKACDEAFFRDSIGSTATGGTSGTEKQSITETPPSSVSARGSGSLDHKVKPRPLPEVPKDSKDTPNTYLQRTLEETREKLAAYKSGGDGDSAKFDEVMQLLNDITSQTQPYQERRSFTAPETRTPDHFGFLPVISEEGDQRTSKDGSANWQRAVTSPLQHREKGNDNTIRVVPSSSPGTVAPLNVRKCTGSLPHDEAQRNLNVKDSRERLQHKRSNARIGELTAIEENRVLQPATNFLRKKQSGWFGLAKKQDPDTSAVESIQYEDLDDNNRNRPSTALTKKEKTLPPEPPASTEPTDLPTSKKRFNYSKHGLGKWLGRKAAKKASADTIDAGDTTFADSTLNNTIQTNHPDRSLDSFFSMNSPSPSSNDGPPVASDDSERSWFARFFHLKPAVKVLCFSIPRGRARQELVLLFKEWQRHGIRDLQYSRETNTITARVDKENTLGIKPVVFRVELFVVLMHGRLVGLSIARFVQVKGAASGFRKVIEVVDGVMRARRWLVEDEEKWRALQEIVDG